MFGQGLVAAHDLPAGSLISPESLSTRKPLRGIPASRYDAVLGRRCGCRVLRARHWRRHTLQEKRRTRWIGDEL